MTVTPSRSFLSSSAPCSRAFLVSLLSFLPLLLAAASCSREHHPLNSPRASECNHHDLLRVQRRLTLDPADRRGAFDEPIERQVGPRFRAARSYAEAQHRRSVSRPSRRRFHQCARASVVAIPPWSVADRWDERHATTDRPRAFRGARRAKSSTMHRPAGASARAEAARR